MIILALMIIHLILLHEKGSSNPVTSKTNPEKIKFHPAFSLKDMYPLLTISLLLIILNSNWPNLIGDVENFSLANPLVAPVHIQPEWYFLFAYVILRRIPSKLGGVVALVISILMLTILKKRKGKSNKLTQRNKTKF